MMASYRVLVRRRWRLAVLFAACVAVGALVSALILPQYLANAGVTSVSTTWATSTNTVNGSVAASSDAPGGAKRGTAKPGDTIKWVVDYQNNTGSPASVDLRTSLQAAGAYVPGSLQLPPAGSDSGTLAAQYSTNAGQTWAPGNPPANVNGVGATGTSIPTGTARRSLNFPAPVPVQITQSGGDVYSLVVRGNLTYGVYHHSTGPVVFCAQQDGSTCPGWPTNSNVQIWSKAVGTPIGVGPEEVGITPNQASPWISGTKLFWPLATPLAGTTAGIACLDLSTVTPTSCGLTNLGQQLYPGANTTAQFGTTGIPASNNGLIYSVALTTQGARLLCINPSTGSSCGSLALDAIAPVSSQNDYTATFGSYVFATTKESPASVWKIYCFNAVSGGLCPGSWPVVGGPASSSGVVPFAPILSTAGAVTGVCVTPNGESIPAGCWNLSGGAVANPYAGTGAHYRYGGDAFVAGTKVYLASNDNSVMCRDFATYSGSGAVPACTGFAVATNGLIANNVNYTVRDASSIAANCLVATGDGRQIIYFNGLTGGPCTGVSGPNTLTVTPLTSYCGTGSAGFRGWGTLSLPGLVTGKYTNATVTLRDQNGNVISGFNNVVVLPGNSLNLSTISTSVTSITATVTVNGVGDPTGVTSGQIAISWTGDPPQMCFQTIAPPVACDAVGPLVLSIRPVATTTSAGGDAPGGNATGVVEFDDQAAASQCSLVIKKTSPVQSARPGEKVMYAVTVQNTGSQAYNSAAFTDDLSDVLKDALYNGDHAASVGTVAYANPVLSWSGGLAASATATITYSVTVRNPDAGDHSMLNTVVSPTVGSNCASGSLDPSCRVTVLVSVTDVLWHKIDATAAKNILAGASWTFTPVDGAGQPTGAPIVVDDCVTAPCARADIDPMGGSFRITNLGPGTYQLVETRAPVGFRLDATPIPVTIGTAATTVSLADVVNKQQPVPVIPFTGGLGTDALTITGGSLLLLTLGAIALRIIRRRRTE